jgi:hypothetical protein
MIYSRGFSIKPHRTKDIALSVKFNYPLGVNDLRRKMMPGNGYNTINDKDDSDSSLDDMGSQDQPARRKNPQKCDLYGSFLLALGIINIPVCLAAVVLYSIEPSDPTSLVDTLLTLGRLVSSGAPILSLLIAIPYFIKLCCCGNDRDRETKRDIEELEREMENLKGSIERYQLEHHDTTMTPSNI